MNKRYLILIPILLLTTFCGQKKNENQTSEKNEVEGIPNKEMDRLTEDKDSLISLRDSLEHELDHVKENFHFFKSDLSGKSYYHKNWIRQEYTGQENMLLAGVDSAGHFFLISNIRGGYPDGNTHDRIEIQTDSNNYTLTSDTLMGKFRSHQMLLCACRWEVCVYSGIDALNIGEIVSRKMNESIKVSFKTEKQAISTILLSRKEKENVRDCYTLTNNIHILENVEKKIKKINLRLEKN